MGSEDFYPEERPVHPVRVSPFLLDRTPVTVAQFARFVEDTGYVTVAELSPDARDYPDVDPRLLVPGGLVFTGTDGPVPLHDPTRWWSWVPGASWRRPEGPGSNALDDRLDHPVTQVSLDDAAAYARWAGGRLPTEAEYVVRAGATWRTPGKGRSRTATRWRTAGPRRHPWAPTLRTPTESWT